MSEPALIALDATVLLGLAENNLLAGRAVELLRERVERCQIVVTPAPIVELALVLERLPASEPVRRLADLALRSLRGDWGFRELDDAGYDRTAFDAHDTALIESGLLPAGARSSAMALLEAAARSCRMLVTWDRALAELPPGRLRLFLLGRGLHPLRVATPRAVAGLYAPRR